MGKSHYRMWLNLNEYFGGRNITPNGHFWDWAMITTFKNNMWNGADYGMDDPRPIECQFKNPDSDMKVMGVVWNDGKWMVYGPHSEAINGYHPDNHHIFIPVKKRYSITNTQAFNKAIRELYEKIK